MTGGAELVGRDRLLRRLAAAIAGAGTGERVTVLVTGEAGIGKTSLLRAAVSAASAVRVCWGVCPDTVGAPGHWPWSQALGALLRGLGEDTGRAMAAEDADLLGLLMPAVGTPAAGEPTERDRLRLREATARFVVAAAEQTPLVLVLDDLQWADESTLALFDFLARDPQPARLCLIGAYRPEEVRSRTRDRLSTSGEHLALRGLDLDAVHTMVETLRGEPVDRAIGASIHARTGGLPFFVREVALSADGGSGVIPGAVADLIERRIEPLSPEARSVLDALAVLGAPARLDVVAGALRVGVQAVRDAVAEAAAAGLVGPDGPQFRHDLLRETVLARLPDGERVDLHRSLGAALADRAGRAGDVAPGEVARQFVAALLVDGPDRATRWAMAAAEADVDALAFDEAAAHLRRLRAAVADSGLELGEPVLLEVLLREADALARAGTPIEARGLLRAARSVARRLVDPEAIARVALASAALGARFAARRDEIVAELEEALESIAGRDAAHEAQVAAALARELQHSVAADRPRAGPLSERALRLGRAAGDPTTLASCLLARHDVLWTPGTATERAEVAREIVAVAQAAGDLPRRADGLLLLATALLEEGSAAFEAPLAEAVGILDGLGTARHRYLAETRRACLALLRGDLDAEERVERAAAIGERIREPDTGNVRMSQRTEVVRARRDPVELREFADEAVAHWTGAPIHAHGIAAGFCARAGDLAGARRHVAAVDDSGGWRADTSYLRAVYVRELAEAAIALPDRDLAADLFAYLAPMARSCGLNAAMIAFAGSHAHTAARLAAALGRPETSALLEQAAATYRRLGAAGWAAEVAAEAGSNEPMGAEGAALLRHGPIWEVHFGGHSATVAHVKGMSDLARLVAVAGREVHVLDLIDAADRSGSGGEVADRTALAAYRRRLGDLDEEIAEAETNADLARASALAGDRDALLDELSRAADVHGRPRSFANTPTERARKAVAGRIRDAIRRLHDVHPDLAAHLDRQVATGTYCRYRDEENLRWEIRAD